MSNPNLIERMENLIHCLDEASTGIVEPGAVEVDPLKSIEDAAGIAGEVLTMIDGR